MPVAAWLLRRFPFPNRVAEKNSSRLLGFCLGNRLFELLMDSNLLLDMMHQISKI
jgi:hypothetical protein